VAEASNKTSTATSSVTRVGWLRPMARFAAWWFSLFALLGPLSVCPLCGQSGCPGGAASAGMLGGVMAAFISALHWICNSARRRSRSGRRCTRKEVTGMTGWEMDEQKGNRMATESAQMGKVRE